MLRRHPIAFAYLFALALWGALALHMALGLRVLTIEFLPLRERTRVAVSAGLAAALAVGVLFLLNVV